MSKSTATRDQYKRIIEALRMRPKTSYDLRRLGIYQAPARIKELRTRVRHFQPFFPVFPPLASIKSST